MIFLFLLRVALVAGQYKIVLGREGRKKKKAGPHHSPILRMDLVLVCEEWGKQLLQYENCMNLHLQ